MKSFKAFIKEEVDLAAYVHSGNLDIDDPSVRDSINTFLTGVTSKCFVTPYIAYERVSKVLANFHVHLPRTTFLENDSGMVVLPVSQFGGKVGMRNDGSVVTKDPQPYHVYFEYRRNEKGLYDVFCEVLDDTELDDIMDDLHGELNDYDDADDDPGSQIMSASDQRKDRLEEGVWKGIKDAFFPTSYTPLNDPNEMIPVGEEPPKKPAKKAVGKKKLSEEGNDPFRNATGLSRPSDNRSMHMQDGDKGFTAMYGKGTPSSTGPKANPNFKPNPAYAKLPSASNLVFKYNSNNPPKLSTTNPVQKGPPITGTPEERNFLTPLKGLEEGQSGYKLTQIGPDGGVKTTDVDRHNTSKSFRDNVSITNQTNPTNWTHSSENVSSVKTPRGKVTNVDIDDSSRTKNVTPNETTDREESFKEKMRSNETSFISGRTSKTRDTTTKRIEGPKKPLTPKPEPKKNVEDIPMSEETLVDRVINLLEESKRQRVKELAARQRERYAKRKGEEPPIMSGPSGYSIPEKEKAAIRGIIKGQKEKRKEAKGAIKAARQIKASAAQLPVQTTQQQKPTTTTQPVSKPFGASVENLVRAYNHYAGLYGQSGDPSHLDAAKKAARGHYATLVSTIAHHPGHPDYDSAKAAAKSILDSHLDALSSLEAVTPKKQIEPPQKKGLLGRIKDIIKE